MCIVEPFGVWRKWWWFVEKLSAKLCWTSWSIINLQVISYFDNKVDNHKVKIKVDSVEYGQTYTLMIVDDELKGEKLVKKCTQIKKYSFS